jgi:hypothetical protein
MEKTDTESLLILILEKNDGTRDRDEDDNGTEDGVDDDQEDDGEQVPLQDDFELEFDVLNVMRVCSSYSN